ncbi:RNA polymerase sigma factor [Methylocystis rosea]|uniref:RNA polymerase sigma factor n=1 Tax=Methylocystis rosea TaxID=173366 RepID=UPI000373232D|nr:RNA polymerase sigma factor [Methylocystis rosea]
MKNTQARIGDADWIGLTDVDIVASVGTGDAGAFAELMRRYNRRLYRTARAVTGDNGEAEDIVQEAWTRAYAHIADFRNESAISTWLVRIVLNEALGRKRRARPTVELDETNEHQMSSVIMLPSCRVDPESSMSRTQVRHLLERAIDTLPPDFRAVFVLRTVEEMSGAEVAQQLGIPEATVKTRLHRARALLRQELEKSVMVALSDVFPFDGARCNELSNRVMARIGLLRDKS